MLLAQTDHFVHSGAGVTFTWSSFGRCDRFPGQQDAACPWGSLADSCDVVALNFGHWALAENNGDGAPWTLGRYSASVSAALSAALSAGVPRAKLLWLTVHPHPDDASVAAATSDWRSGEALRLYAAAGLVAAAAARVAAVDVFSIADAVRDLSYDGSHYSAPVEVGVARAVHRCVMAMLRVRRPPPRPPAAPPGET